MGIIDKGNLETVLGIIEDLAERITVLEDQVGELQEHKDTPIDVSLTGDFSDKPIITIHGRSAKDVAHVYQALRILLKG